MGLIRKGERKINGVYKFKAQEGDALVTFCVWKWAKETVCQDQVI